MEDWETVKLGDVIELDTGYPFKSKKFTENKDDIPLVKGSNLQQGYIDWDEAKKWPEEEFEDFKDYELKEGDVVLAMDRPWVSAGLKYSWIKGNDPKSLLVQRIARLRSNGKLRQDYLRYLIASRDFTDYIKPIVTGVNVPHISPNQIKSFEFNLPPLSIQKEVASILSPFDDLIENNSRRIEILEEMARRIYREWFVHFRYPGHEDDELVDSGTDEFDAMPEEWDMKVMDEILEHYIGGTWGKEEPEEEKNNPAYVIRGTDIPGGRSGNVDDIPLRYHKQSYINSRKLQHGDIVFEVSGGSKDQPVGRAMLITDTFLSELDCDDVVHASFCKLLRSDKSILKSEIFYLHIREIYDDRRIMKYQVQSTGISNFKFTFFAENKQMFIPPMELQEKFQEKVSPLFKQMYILGKQINRLKETRDLLLPKLISGKIEVAEVTAN